MKTICSWCEKVLVDGPDDGSVSHGFCGSAACLARFEGKDSDMKIPMSEATARKALAAIPADTKDQDLRQLRDRLEQGLKAAANGGRLTLDELVGLKVAAGYSLQLDMDADTVTNVSQFRMALTTAIPKLEALIARTAADQVEGGR